MSNQIDLLVNVKENSKAATTNIVTSFKEVQTSLGGAGNAVQRLVGQFQALAGGFALLKGFQFFKNLAEEAARVEALSTVLHQVASNAGITAGAIDKVDKAVQALGITAADSRESLSQFIQAGLQATDASKLARAAQDLAVISGETSSATFKGLTQAIGEMSIMMLRFRGIMVTNEEAQSRYAAQMGKSVSSLADWEKKQALLNAVLEKSKGLTGIYEAAMGDASKQASSLTRYQTEAANAINTGVIPAYQAVITELTKFLIYVRADAEASLNAGDAAASLGASVKSVASAFRETLEFAIQHKDVIIKVAEAYGVLKVAQGISSVGKRVGANIAVATSAVGSGNSAVGARAAASQAASAEASASNAATNAKTAEARATDRLTASLAASTAAYEQQTLARRVQSANVVGPMPLSATSTAHGLQLAAATAANNSLLAAQVGVQDALTSQAAKRLVLQDALNAATAANLPTNTVALNLLRAEVATADALVLSSKSFAASELAATEIETKKLALMTAQGAAAARTAAAQTVGVGSGITGAFAGAAAQVGAFFKNIASGAGVLGRIATVAAGVGRTLLSIFGGWIGLAVTVVGSWLLMGDGVQTLGKAFDKVGLSAKNALSHVKEFFAAKEDKGSYAAERLANEKKFNKDNKVTATDKDPKSVASYKEAAMEAARAAQDRIEYEYTEAPKAQKLKASHSKEDQEESARIEQAIVDKKLTAIAAQSVAETKLLALKASGKGKAAEEVTSLVDKEAFEGGKRKQNQLDVQDLSNAREQIGGTKNVFSGGEPISMGVAKAATAARREIEAYQKNLDGVDKSIYRIKFALDAMAESATSVADIEFVKNERLAVIDEAAQKVEVLGALIAGKGNTFEEGSKGSKAYKAQEADIKKESVVTDVSEVEIAEKRRAKAKLDQDDFLAIGDPSKALKRTNLSSQASALAFYESQKAGGNVSAEELAKVNTITDKEKESKKDRLASDAAWQGKTFDKTKDLSAGQLKDIIDDHKADLARKKLIELQKELGALTGKQSDINQFNEAFSKMAFAIAKVTKETEKLGKALGEITSLRTNQIDRKYEESAYTKSESIGSADVGIDKKLDKARESYKLNLAANAVTTDFATKKNNIDYADKIGTNQRSYEKEVEAVATKKEEKQAKDKVAAGGNVTAEHVEAAKTDFDSTVATLGGKARLASTLKILEIEKQIQDLPTDKRTTEEETRLNLLKAQKLIAAQALEDNSNVTTVVDDNTASGGNGTRDIKATEKKLDETQLGKLSEAYNKKENTHTAYLNGDYDKIHEEANAGRTNLGVAKSEASAKGNVESSIKELELINEIARTREKLSSSNNNGDKVLQAKIAELEAEKTKVVATKDTNIESGAEKVLGSKDEKNLTQKMAESSKLEGKESDAAKAAGGTTEDLYNKSVAHGVADKAALIDFEAGKDAITKQGNTMAIQAAQKHYSELKAIRDEYYKSYTDKVKGTKDLHKADIDLGSRIKTTAAEDAIDTAQTRIAPDKALVGSLQAQEGQQKFDAGAAGHNEELAAITTLANQRKKLIMESGKDAATIAKEIAAVEADSISKRLESSRTYFSTLENQRKEAKAKWKQYADEVVSIDKEIRSNTLEANASMRDTMRSVMTAPAQLQDLKKEYKELMEAAKGAAAAGDFEQAKEYSKKAGTVAKGIAGHEGGQKLDTTADSLKMQGDAAGLTNDILGKQGAIAKKNRDEQLAIVSQMTEAMTGLANTIGDLSKKSEIILNPKLDEAALANIEKELQGLSDTQDKAINLQFAAPDIAGVWSQVQDAFNNKAIELKFSKGSETSTEPSNSDAAAVGPAATTSPVKKADGGMIQGVGTGTSDSIPALLSHGEFVVKQDSVAHYGQGFLDLLNSKALKFASGGFVSTSPVSPWANAATRLAAGGEVPKFGMGGELLKIMGLKKETPEMQAYKENAKREREGAKTSGTTLSSVLANTEIGQTAKANQEASSGALARRMKDAGLATGGFPKFGMGGELLKIIGLRKDTPEQAAYKAQAKKERDEAKAGKSGTTLTSVISGTEVGQTAKDNQTKLLGRTDAEMKRLGLASGGEVPKFGMGGELLKIMGLKKDTPEQAAYKAQAAKEREEAKANKAGSAGGGIPTIQNTVNLIKARNEQMANLAKGGFARFAGGGEVSKEDYEIALEKWKASGSDPSKKPKEPKNLEAARIKAMPTNAITTSSYPSTVLEAPKAIGSLGVQAPKGDVKFRADSRGNIDENGKEHTVSAKQREHNSQFITYRTMDEQAKYDATNTKPNWNKSVESLKYENTNTPEYKARTQKTLDNMVARADQTNALSGLRSLRGQTSEYAEGKRQAFASDYKQAQATLNFENNYNKPSEEAKPIAKEASVESRGYAARASDSLIEAAHPEIKRAKQDEEEAISRRVITSDHFAQGGIVGKFSEGGAITNKEPSKIERLLNSFGVGGKDRSRFANAAKGVNPEGKVPALVSHGEFRISPDAVNHYGSDLMHSVNQMSFPKFAEGGMIGAGTSAMGDADMGEVFNHIIQLQSADKTKAPIPLKARNSGDVKSMLAALRSESAVNLA